MIRGGDPHGIVPRAQPDDRGLTSAMARADQRGEAEAAEKATSQQVSARAEEALLKSTRALCIDGLFRAKVLNGDADFDADDVADLDAAEQMASRIVERRRARQGAGA